MIEPGKHGHRSGSVARGAARQVTSRKTGVRLTWILPPITGRGGQPWRTPSKRTAKESQSGSRKPGSGLTEAATSAALTSASADTRSGGTAYELKAASSRGRIIPLLVRPTQRCSPRPQCHHLRLQRGVKKTCKGDSRFGLLTIHTTVANRRRAVSVSCGIH